MQKARHVGIGRELAGAREIEFIAGKLLNVGAGRLAVDGKVEAGLCELAAHGLDHVKAFLAIAFGIDEADGAIWPDEATADRYRRASPGT